MPKLIILITPIYLFTLNLHEINPDSFKHKLTKRIK